MPLPPIYIEVLILASKTKYLCIKLLTINIASIIHVDNAAVKSRVI